MSTTAATPTNPWAKEGEAPLVSVRNLKKYFPMRKGLFAPRAFNKAVDDVSFDVPRGTTVAHVGESGSGKSTVSLMLLDLLAPTDGEILYEGKPFSARSGAERRGLRREMQVVFQDPYASLNARMTVRETLTEGMIVHRMGGSAAEREERCLALLKQVGMPPEALDRYPHEFSGGQRQRLPFLDVERHPVHGRLPRALEETAADGKVLPEVADGEQGLAHVQTGIQRGIGVLKNDLHLPPQGTALGSAPGRKRLALVENLAAGGCEQIEQHQTDGGLARAGLADQGNRGSTRHIERHVIHGLFKGARREQPLAQREVFLQVAYGNERRAITHRAAPSEATGSSGALGSGATGSLAIGSAPRAGRSVISGSYRWQRTGRSESAG